MRWFRIRWGRAWRWCRDREGEGRIANLSAMTVNISLRPYSVLDIDALVEAALESVTEINPWLPWCHREFCATDAQDWIDSQIQAREADSEYQFVIEGSQGEFLGGCGLNHIVRMHRIANLGYWVRTSACGNGIATTAIRLLAEWAFQNTDLNRLEIVVALGNMASDRVATKAGGFKEAVLAKRLWLHGRSVDATMYALTRDDWCAA